MPGELFWKEGTIATLEAIGGTITTGSAVEANDATLDLRAGGTAGNLLNLDFTFSLLCQWATITSIVAGVVAAELYAVKAIDGTNYPDVDLTGGASVLPMSAYLGNFPVAKAPTANTNMLFDFPWVRMRPALYKVYLLGRAGQTITAGWVLKVISARNQYT